MVNYSRFLRVIDGYEYLLIANTDIKDYLNVIKTRVKRER